MSNYDFDKEQIKELSKFADSIINETEHYDFMFHLVSTLRLSIEEICEIYINLTFDDVKLILVEKFNVEFKKCNNCNKTKSTTSFSIKSWMTGYLSSFCKICKAQKQKQKLDSDPSAKQKSLAANNLYYNNNKEQIYEHHRNYFQDHKEERKTYNENNKDKIKKHVRTYYDKHKSQIFEQKNEYRRERRINDINFHLRSSFPVRIYNSIKQLKGGRHWEDIVGYTLEQLMTHLESKFDDKMNWDNYGSYWQIDHIVPVAAFNYTSVEDQSFKNCWSLKNLQPLKSEDNLIKCDIINEQWGNVELAAQLL